VKWSRTAVLLFPLAVASAALFWALLRPREPEPIYQGRTLSQWLIAAVEYRYSDREKALQATNAVHHIGTNALPWLIRGLDCEIPKWRDDLVDHLPRQTFFHPRLARPLLGPDGTRVWLSVTGFEILGEEAAPALPALTALAGNWESPGKCAGVILALTHLGNSGSTSLVSVVTNTSIPTRQRITAARFLTLPVGGPRTNLTWAIPGLARCSGETEISQPVAETLAALANQSPTVVPKLIEACSSPDAATRQGATNALRFISPEKVKDELR
jgi:hypothetical protein